MSTLAIQGCSLSDQHHSTTTLNQGDCVNLNSDEGTYQIISLDDQHDRCWVRRWPIDPDGSPVFEISLRQIEVIGC